MHTGLFMPRFNMFRSLPKLLLGLFPLCGALLLGSVPPGAAAAQQGSEVSLKLDRDMVPILGTQGLNLEALISSGHASELQSRLLKLRDQITTLDQANVEDARQLSERGRFVDEIRELVSKQEKLIDSLRDEIRRPAARVSAAPVAMPRATPSPAPPATTSSSPIRLGPIELPAGLENWLPEGALGVVVVLLLIMTLHFRSHAKSKDAELAELADFVMRERGAPAATQVEAPAGDEDRTEPKARIEDVSGDSRPAVKAPPSKPEAAPPPQKREAPPPKLKAPPPPKLEAVPVTSKEDVASADSAMDKMEKTADLAAIGDEAGSPSADATDRDQDTIDWTKTMLGRKAGDLNPLEEVDTLIAYGDYEKARLLLEGILQSNPTNPEYRLRMLHLEATTGDKDKAELEARILAEMMEGPLSDTIRRVKEIGRGLMPGHPLFDDAESLDEARQLLDKFESEEQQEAAQPSQDGSGHGDTVDLGETVDFFNLISAKDELVSKEDGAAAGPSDGDEDSETLDEAMRLLDEIESEAQQGAAQPSQDGSVDSDSGDFFYLISEEDEAPPGRSDGGGDAEVLVEGEDRAETKAPSADRDAVTQAAAASTAPKPEPPSLTLEAVPPKPEAPSLTLEAAPPKPEASAPKLEASSPKLEAAPPEPEVTPPKSEVTPPKPEAAPPKLEAAPPKLDASSLTLEAAPPPKLETVPVASKEDAASANSAMERTVLLSGIHDEADSPSADATGGDQDTIDWRKTMLGREAADPGVLNDVDLLIAFQDYDKAKLLLEKTLRENPTNPEYRLRMLHLQATIGNKDKAELEARILAEMMEGPLSDTIRRVKEIGRGLMPGHPLFDDTESLDEAKQLLDKLDGEEQQGTAQPSQDGSGQRDTVNLAETVDFFNLISEEDELIGEEDEVPPGRSDGGEDSEALVEDEDRAETKARSADGDAATQAAAASTPLSLETAPPTLEAELPKLEAAPPKPEAAPPKPEAAPPKPEAAPPKPEAKPPKPEAEPPKLEAAPPPKLEAAPVASKEDAASADSAMKKMEKTMFFSEIRDEAGSPSADATGGDDETIDVRKAMRDRKAADPNTLREIDTLIAFEAYDKARLLLKKSLRETPTNPEYRLRMLHLEATTGNKEKAALEERMIAEMMEGPLSDTIRRVKEIGRGLMPGHPLFDDAKSLDEAKQLLDKIESEEQQEAAQPSQDGSGQRDTVNLGETVDFFNLISAEDELISGGDEAAAGRSDGGGDAETLAKDEDRAKAKSRDADRDAATQAAASADAAGSDQGKIDWTKTMLDRKAADPNALKEVDTLIAFEAYDKAKVLLKEILKGNPANPEYRLRMLHLEATTGDKDKAELEERILAEMMEGPLSDTIRRVKEIGRGLMPGNPLFDDAETLDEARQLLDKFESEEQQEPAQASQDGSGQRDTVNLAETVDFFNLISAEDELTSEQDEAPAGRSDGGGGDGSKKP